MIILEKVTVETLGIFGDLKVKLMKEHIPYATELDLNDKVCMEYDLSKAIRHFNEKNYTQYLIKDNGNILGACEISDDNNEATGHKIINIHNLYLKSIYRGQGYGKQVIELLKDICPNLELECYYNMDAHKFYESLGFKRMYTHYFIN